MLAAPAGASSAVEVRRITAMVVGAGWAVEVEGSLGVVEGLRTIRDGREMGISSI